MNAFNKITLIFFLSLGVLNTFAQEKTYTISGYIEDQESSERLIGATVFAKESDQGTATNAYGFFSITLKEGEHTLQISYVGYGTKNETFTLNKDISTLISLSNSVTLESVVITAEDEPSVEETQMGKMVVPVEQLKAVPVILGESDILKGLQLLPGVQSGGEAQTGLYVRGGSPDQNLILLDGVPVYNPSHLLGFFSVFNSDAIKSVSLTKGAFPARFGGRLSSVVDIRMKEGNLNKFTTEGSVGLISSRLTLQGPINKGKTSFLLSGRRTYIDLVAKPLIDTDGEKPIFHFYDLNGKIQHKINDHHRLYLSGYQGNDAFGYEDRGNSYTDSAIMNWGNYISSLRWNWEISPKLFMNTTATLSNYELDIEAKSESHSDGETESYSTKYVSGIKDIGVKVDLDYLPHPNHAIKIGLASTQHAYKPGAVTFKNIDEILPLDTLINTNDIKSIENSIYAEDEMQIGKLKMNVGLHASTFTVPNKTYFSIQPRIGLNYKIRENLALKASYSEMAQYINLLTNESLSLPTDLWVPSTAQIKPQTSKQVALGLASTLSNTFEVSAEAYYKKMDNVISYNEGANFLFNPGQSWEDKVTQGKGDSYGMELFVQKNKGRLSGWLGYTLSWNNRQFDNINNGNPFPFKYDRRHDFSIVGTYKYSDRILLSANWVYGSGNAVSLNNINIPTKLISNPFTRVLSTASNTDKNSHRLSATHRLDMSISFIKKKKRFERSLVIGVYNLYGRKNPFMITKHENQSPTAENNKVSFKEISLLRFIPSISYNFKF